MNALPILIALSLPCLAGSPPELDRQAILSMAGDHAVTFHFEETAAIAPGYSIRPKSYEAKATESVTVAEDSENRIILQHLLFVPSDEGTRIIKHWAQVWTWEDREILDYSGSEELHEWQKVALTAEQATGSWSQLITQVDDTPRYESYGHWTHANGESSWTSNPTRRPLPRREYSKRDDYDYLLVTNQHTLTPNGWIHEQQNRKVVDRDDQPIQVLCHESGLNTYTRTDSSEGKDAVAWWKENHPFWDTVRSFWIDAGESAPRSFAYTSYKNGQSLSELLKKMEKEKPAPEQITAALNAYVISN